MTDDTLDKQSTAGEPAGGQALRAEITGSALAAGGARRA